MAALTLAALTACGGAEEPAPAASPVPPASGATAEATSPAEAPTPEPADGAPLDLREHGVWASVKAGSSASVRAEQSEGGDDFAVVTLPSGAEVWVGSILVPEGGGCDFDGVREGLRAHTNADVTETTPPVADGEDAFQAEQSFYAVLSSGGKSYTRTCLPAGERILSCNYDGGERAHALEVYEVCQSLSPPECGSFCETQCTSADNPGCDSSGCQSCMEECRCTLCHESCDV